MAIIKRDQAPHAYNLEPVWHDSNSAYSKTPGGADSTQKLQTQIGVFGYQLHPFQWVPPVSLHCLLLPQSGGLPAPFKAAYAGGGGGGRGVALPQGSPAAALHRHSATPGQPRGGPTPVALRLGQPQQRPCVGLDPPPRWPCRAPLPLCPLASSDGTPPARPFLAAAPRLPPFRRP
jgi:hypothetical protein